MQSIQKLLNIMAKLRSPQGCPWDREQDHQSIRPQLLAECYELLEAIDELDDSAMKEELGDVLLHVVFHAQMAKERGAFDFNAVADTLADKLVRRHPHVFAADKVSSSDEVLGRWHEIKKKEKPERTSALSGVPKHLPALMQAQEIQKKAARAGFDWKKTAPVLAKIREEIRELEQSVARHKIAHRHIEEELGDLLFSLVNLSRHLKIDAEQACRLATTKFTRRFQWIEKKIGAEKFASSSLKELDVYWEKAKKALKRPKTKKNRLGGVR
ncbi:MAG: nucleoside triphosphate pyrophosphohydrolase [bacterium]